MALVMSELTELCEPRFGAAKIELTAIRQMEAHVRNCGIATPARKIPKGHLASQPDRPGGVVLAISPLLDFYQRTFALVGKKVHHAEADAHIRRGEEGHALTRLNLEQLGWLSLAGSYVEVSVEFDVGCLSASTILNRNIQTDARNHPAAEPDATGHNDKDSRLGVLTEPTLGSECPNQSDKTQSGGHAGYRPRDHHPEGPLLHPLGELELQPSCLIRGLLGKRGTSCQHDDRCNPDSSAHRYSPPTLRPSSYQSSVTIPMGGTHGL